MALLSENLYGESRNILGLCTGYQAPEEVAEISTIILLLNNAMTAKYSICIGLLT